MKIRQCMIIFMICVISALFFGCQGIQTSGDTYYYIALSNYADEAYDEAIANCETALEEGMVKESVSNLYKLWAACYYELDMYDEAITYGEKAVEADDENHEAWTNLGIVYRLNGDFEKAIECYEKAISIDPDYAEAYSSLGTIYILLEKPEEAINYFKQAIDLNASLAVAHGNLALAYAMTGNFQEADTTLKQAIAIGYDRADDIKQRIDDLRSYD